MAICEICGKEYDEDEAQEEFERECDRDLKNGNHFNECLCFECARDAIEENNFYDFCEECGARFHVGEADLEFEDKCGEYHLIDSARMDISTKILCADCALDVAREDYERLIEEDPDYYDDNEKDIDVYQAAEIWASHGKDEDYMFGYTEEELEEALK